MYLYSVCLILTFAATPVLSRAAAQGIPAFKMEELCHKIVAAAAPVMGGTPTVTFDECMKDEQDDRDLLIKEWPGFTATERKSCISAATAGGEPSYTELIGCLENAQKLRK